ncbi:MAG TPA: hypothetical protein DF613_05235, partial [Lachnospiraceae bacterium]|nr:hypothetical protein [Lachnospiraceae bacterium]
MATRSRWLMAPCLANEQEDYFMTSPKNQNKPKRAGWIVCAAAAALMIGFLPAPSNAASGTSSADNIFTFSDGSISASGNGTGHQINGTDLAITAPGTYALKGGCDDGSVTVEKGITGVVLVLNGLTLSSADTAPVSCEKSTEVTIEVAAGTINTLTDSGENNDETYPGNENAENAVIKCKDGSQVIICGTGTLNINANGKNGIKSGAATEADGEASLTIQETTLNIMASVNDAINAEQLLNIESGALIISAEDDAIHSDLELNIGASGTTGPGINIQKSCEGLEAATLNVYSGDINITSSDDCMNAANSDLNGYAFSMAIFGGTINTYSSGGDGFDSNGSLTISGGNVVVWTASIADNQPLDADGIVTVSGGTVLAAGGSGGMGMNLNASQPCVIFGAATGINGQQPGNTGSQWFNGNSFSISKGSTFSIQNDSGGTVYCADAPCNAGYMFFSAADLVSGNNYSLCSGNTDVATEKSQTGTSVNQQPGGIGGTIPGNPGSVPGESTGTIPNGAVDAGHAQKTAEEAQKAAEAAQKELEELKARADVQASELAAAKAKAEAAEKVAQAAMAEVEKLISDNISTASVATLTNIACNKVRVSWSKVNGADGYEVYRSTSQNGTFTPVSVIENAGTVKYTDSKLSCGKTYYYKIRAYKEASSGRIYGAYSAAKKIK